MQRFYTPISVLIVLVAGYASTAMPAHPQATDESNDPVKFWTESDSVDGRWNQTDLGRFLASVIELPDGPVRKGLSIRVGDGGEATVCYDTEHLALRGAWSGGFLKFDPARYGIINSPAVDGELLFSAPESSRAEPGWQAETVEYLGMYIHGERVVLRYRVDGVEVLESPWAEGVGSLFSEPDAGEHGPDNSPLRKKTPDPVRVTRTFEIAPHDRPLVLNTNSRATPQIMIPARGEVQRLQVVYTASRDEGIEQVELLESPSVALREWTHGGPARWPETVVVRGERSRDESRAYVIDKITLPLENPYRALMFVGGHGFFTEVREQNPEVRGQTSGQKLTADSQQPAPPDMAICTMHGEVWTVSGVDDDLDRLEWRRFATGLFQPLGMIVIDNVTYVLGRDQITRLHDTNGDGEADYYENFCNIFHTSAGRHDFNTCLERDDAGNLYFAHAVEGVLRVSPDGKQCEPIASGLRNPNGLGASPDGFVTVTPQQGNWTPSSGIFHVRPGEYYGFPGPKVTPDRPHGYDPPLCWIPHSQDNSSGGQAWVTSDRWGPLTGQMLHFSYGQCTMMLTLREEVDGQWQGGNVDFPLLFDSGAMRGRFSPRDGQLYVSGLRGWQNRAALDGCLARVRYTGRPVDMPVAVRTMQNGLAITFTRPLGRAAAEDAANYGVQRWNYRYRQEYGSPDLSVENPGEEGRDDVAVRSATLLEDGRTVFLEISDLRPADQYLVQYAIAAADGAALEQEFSYTIHAVGSEQTDESLLRRTPAGDGLPAEVAENLAPGLILRFSQGTTGGGDRQAGSLSHGGRDVRTGRLAAWYVAAGDPPTPRLAPGAFSATAEGYLHIRQPGRYRFALSGSGRASLSLGQNRGEARSVQAEPSDWMEVRLGNGYHPLAIEYESPAESAEEDAQLRLWWSGGAFRPEPVPPDLLHHPANDAELIASERHYRGRELFTAHNCAACHGAGSAAAEGGGAANPGTVPDLSGAARRLARDWLAAWIENPHEFRASTRMPGLPASLSEQERRRAAADLAAFVLRVDAREAEPSREYPDNAVPGEAPERDGLAGRGELLYERLACLACHRLTPPGQVDEHERISLHFAAAKFQEGALAEYLRAPHRHHVLTRMPDFRLTGDEARALEAFLRRDAAELARSLPDKADPTRGRELFATLGCANCHAVENVRAAVAVPLAFGDTANVADGCLAADDRRRLAAPVYRFTSDDRAALEHFLHSNGRSLTRRAPLDSSARLIRELRCTACHDRDGQFASRDSLTLDEGITGLAPEPLPSLTWTGEKLRPEWIERFVAGHIASPRPWLHSRMPHYAEQYAESLARGLAAEHGLPPVSRAPAETDESLAEVGRRLTLQTALDCRQCHGGGDLAPRGDEQTLSAPGINFVDVAPRVRREFFFRLLHDPLRVDPRTKMPKLAEQGKTKITEHFDGDAERQFEAIWHHIQDVGKSEQEEGQTADGR